MAAEMACRNIGPRQRRVRFVGAGWLFALSAAVGAGLTRLDWWRGTRLLVALPLFVAASSLFEALDQTCVALARQDLQNLDTHRSPLAGTRIADAGLARQLRRQARAVNRKALLTSLALTAVVLVVP